MARKLKLWNGRAIMVDRKYDHAYVAAYSRADARRVIAEYKGRTISDNEIKEYWSEGCWGNAMDHVVPERGLWLSNDKDQFDPQRVVPAGAETKLVVTKRIEVDRVLFENLCADRRCLEHLKAAGIDNTEAFSIGYSNFLKAEALRDD